MRKFELLALIEKMKGDRRFSWCGANDICGGVQEDKRVREVVAIWSSGV